MIKIPQQQERDAFPTSAAGNGSKSHNAKGSVAKPIKTKPSILKSTGPRTPEGKARSRFNAIKYGLFSKVLLLEGESSADYVRLLNGLQKDLQPMGTFETVLVESLASLLWRKRRLFQAENAEISEQIEFTESDFRAKRYTEASESPAALASGGFLKHTRGLVLVRESTKELAKNIAELCSHRKLFEDADKEFEEHGCKPQKGWRDLSSALAKDMMISVGHIMELEKSLETADRKRLEHRASAALIPYQEVSERLLRYETHFGREIDRILNQLERLQKMRKGEPVPPTLNVNVSA